MLLLLSSLSAGCYRPAVRSPEARLPGDPLPLYGLPLDVECLRVAGGSRRSVRTSRQRLSGRAVTSESAEAALEHYHGAQRLDVLTFAPAESMAADYLFFREPGSRQRGPMPTMPGAPVTAAIVVDGAPASFAGYEVPGLAVLLATRADHAIGMISRGWPLGEISLVTSTDLASYESIELEDLRIVLRGEQIGLAEDPVEVHRGQPGDYVRADGTVWTWLKRWRLVAGVHLRVYDLIGLPWLACSDGPLGLQGPCLGSLDARHIGSA